MEIKTEPSISAEPRWKREFGQLRLIALTAALTLLAVYAATRFRAANDAVTGPLLAEMAPSQPEPPGRGYQFSTDWFTPYLPVWDKALATYRGKPGLNYLEIGVFEGRSCVWMLENILTDPTARLTCVDVFEDPLKSKFLANIERTGAASKVTLIVGPSQKELRKLPLDSFDIIYIDGSHSVDDVLEDGILAWRLVKEGGLLIFDDYLWENPRNEAIKPKPAIDLFYKIYGKHFEVIHCDHQVFMRKRATAPDRRTS